MKMINCKTCNIDKNENDFYIKKSCKNGFSKECKNCISIRKKEVYKIKSRENKYYREKRKGGKTISIRLDDYREKYNELKLYETISLKLYCVMRIYFDDIEIIKCLEIVGENKHKHTIYYMFIAMEEWHEAVGYLIDIYNFENL